MNVFNDIDLTKIEPLLKCPTADEGHFQNVYYYHQHHYYYYCLLLNFKNSF